MAELRTFCGSSALSDFRRQSIAQRIGVKEVQAQYVHYVALDDPRVQDEEGRGVISILQELLTYGDKTVGNIQSEIRQEFDDIFFVFPRLGTISAWSSKATSIAHVCGLQLLGNVQRIERGTVIKVSHRGQRYNEKLAQDLLHDRMTQTLSQDSPNLELMFAQRVPAPVGYIRLNAGGSDPKQVLREANKTLGLALDEAEIDYLVRMYGPDGPVARDPTDAELFMFSQINSEHCRHKQFNASWTIDGIEKPHSLFSMIRNTHECSPKYTISAYSDNAAVFEGHQGSFFAPDRFSGEWKQTAEAVPFLGKVETHNHPTSVLPFEVRLAYPLWDPNSY